VRRAQAVKQWGVIASGGEIDDDTRAWLADVAKKLLLANDEKDSNDFRTAVTRAVGFTGQGDDSLRIAIRAAAAGINGIEQLRVVVRALRGDLQSKLSARAIDLQLSAPSKNNATNFVIGVHHADRDTSPHWFSAGANV